MRICLVSPELFSWGYHGGFGFLTRTLGRELAKRGHEVSAVTVRRSGQSEVEELDGIKVYGFPSHAEKPHALRAVLSRLASMDFYGRADADIYHSEAVSYNTFVAQRAVPDGLHIITFQDPFDLYEWYRMSLVDPRYHLTPAFKARFQIESRILARACRRADALYSQAKFLIEKATKVYGLRRTPGFLPNPVKVPSRPMQKADDPTVCFLARWDPQKRVEKFFKLAEEFSDVEFIAMGRSHDPDTDMWLRKRYGGIPNLRLIGFVSEEEKSRILERSWVLVNTSIREALPVSFLEALAHETPILSGENPDDLTSTFGYHVTDGSYARGLKVLLEDDDRRGKGRRGRRLIEEVYEVNKVVDRHVEIYRALLEARR